MAGYDLEVEDTLEVPLRIGMHVCVKDGYIAADVERALLGIFSDQMLPDGTLGVFHPDNLDLGQPIYLSTLYARAQAVDGVASVSITRFEREATPGDPTGLTNGVLVPDRLELFMLENDPNFPERRESAHTPSPMTPECSSPDLCRIKSRHDHDAALQSCAEQQRRPPLRRVVDIPEHEAEITRPFKAQIHRLLLGLR
jgi:hypothetical protein